MGGMEQASRGWDGFSGCCPTGSPGELLRIEKKLPRGTRVWVGSVSEHGTGRMPWVQEGRSDSEKRQ